MERGLDWHGRRHGKKLRPGRQVLIDGVLPRLRFDLPDDPGAAFGGEASDIWMEIGFGGGEHLAGQALAHPEIGFIGCEPFVNGVASLLSLVDAGGIGNIRVYDDDARPLLNSLPDASIGRVYVLFADPWPKKRHHKRRFIGAENLGRLARVMKDGAELRFASDHSEYVGWALERLSQHPDFDWTARSAVDWRQPPADWTPTRYEQKALNGGQRCTYLSFLRAKR
ncbi:MAG: tRNA (guanosine(46)-N7)-methyltransferase TrmB [Rhodospirillaceae bacterium]|nr:tRNA (guanosine(46)-N7)-methyltransferase TrmB [Rhodospirillaceae bacterium]